MIQIELIIGVGVDQRIGRIALPAVPRIGDIVSDHEGSEDLGTVYLVNWFADADYVQVRVQ